MQLKQLKDKIEAAAKECRMENYSFEEVESLYYPLTLYFILGDRNKVPGKQEQETFNVAIRNLADLLIKQNLEPYFQICDVFSQLGIRLIPEGMSQNDIENYRMIQKLRDDAWKNKKQREKDEAIQCEELNQKLKKIKTFSELERLEQEVLNNGMRFVGKRRGYEAYAFSYIEENERGKVKYLYSDGRSTGTSYIENLHAALKIM